MYGSCKRIVWLFLSAACVFLSQFPSATIAQDAPAPRGSIVEDRAARKLIEAGDTRFDMDETGKAVEIWKSVIERYPRSRVRYLAHLRLGNFFLERDRSYDRARSHFEIISGEDNRDEEQRAEATTKIGICYYHDRNYGKCFQVMRDVIEQFPISSQVNQAYYYIGLGHFQLKHYSRAIEALNKVGTTLGTDDDVMEKLEAGKRLFVKVEDADLAILDAEDTINVQATSSGGDSETFACFPVGRNVRLVMGSIPTRLGNAQTNSGYLDIKGGDRVTVIYLDQHTAAKELDRKVIKEVIVVGNGHVQITDGAFSEPLRGVVLGKSINVQISDADGDQTDDADQITAVLEVYRLKTEEEMDAETAKIAADKDASGIVSVEQGEEPDIDPFKRIDRVDVTLAEVFIPQEKWKVDAESSAAGKEKTAEVTADESNKGGDTEAEDNQQSDNETGSEEPAVEKEPVAQEEREEIAVQPVDPSLIHSGVFRVVVPLEKSEEIVEGDQLLQALPGDTVKVVYLDQAHRGEGTRQLEVSARCLEGNIGGVRVTRAVISDAELRIQTKLKTADALTKIGNRYKEFGLKDNAKSKYEQALAVCEEVMKEARKLRGRTLEQTYVQIWNVYFEMDQFNMAAAMCQRLQKEFPESGFVDDAMLQLADVSRKQGEFNRAIGIYSRLVRMDTSQLRGDAQFGVASCYNEMALAAAETGKNASQLHDRAFQEYKRVFDNFPDSGRVGEAVSQMANYYYEQKDYSRAIDTFEAVLSDHPDAKFLDVILFNYGRCLYRMGRRAEARKRFDQLISEFPESQLAPDAKKISDALANAK